MAAGSGMRVGDAERNATAESLREHYAAGRLDLDEFQERLDAAFAAKTDLDLEKLTDDLPHVSAHTAPWPPSRAGGPSGSLPTYPLSGSQQAPPAGGAWVRTLTSIAFILSFFVLAMFVILALPFGGPFKGILLILAAFGLLRRVLRRVFGGSVRRGGRW